MSRPFFSKQAPLKDSYHFSPQPLNLAPKSPEPHPIPVKQSASLTNPQGVPLLSRNDLCKPKCSDEFAKELLFKAKLEAEASASPQQNWPDLSGSDRGVGGCPLLPLPLAPVESWMQTMSDLVERSRFVGNNHLSPAINQTGTALGLPLSFAQLQASPKTGSPFCLTPFLGFNQPFNFDPDFSDQRQGISPLANERAPCHLILSSNSSGSHER
jgi:hypothetical protein